MSRNRPAGATVIGRVPPSDGITEGAGNEKQRARRPARAAFRLPLAVALLLGFGAWAPAYEAETRWVLENDYPRLSIWGSDHGYTNGIALYHASAGSIPRPILAAFSALALEPTEGTAALTTSWGLGLGQQMHTPENLDATTVVASDRP